MASSISINGFHLWPDDWDKTPDGSKYQGQTDPLSGQPNGLGILKLRGQDFYVGELRQGKRHGRGFVLHLKVERKRETYYHRYSYEEVMSTAEFDSCGRVIHTGPGGEVRTIEKKEGTYIKEKDGWWEDDVFKRPADLSLLQGEPFCQCELSYQDGEVSKENPDRFIIHYGPYVASLSEMTDRGVVKFNGYESFVTPYDDHRLLVLTSDHALFIVGAGEISEWKTISKYGHHMRSICAMLPK